MLRLDDWQAIRELAKLGLTISAIVKTTGFSRNTVKKHLRSAPAPPADRFTPPVRRPITILTRGGLAYTRAPGARS